MHQDFLQTRKEFEKHVTAMDEVVCNVNTKICLFTYLLLLLLLLLLLFFSLFFLTLYIWDFLNGKTDLSWCKKQAVTEWSRLEAVGPWEFPQESALPFLQA